MIVSRFSTFNLERLYSGLYLLRFKNYYDMCMTFLRQQEKYESPNIKFRGKNFTILDFMEWYSKNRHKKKPFFSYTTDWGGFNLPDTMFKGNWFDSIPDQNKYDRLMLDVCDTICQDIKCGSNKVSLKYYLIGAVGDEAVDHEIAHGFYYLNREYKLSMDHLTNNLPKIFKNKTFDYFKKAGYTSKVFKDEMQAYIATGFPEHIIKVPKNFKQLQKEYKKVYNNARNSGG